MPDMTLSEELQWRGFINQTTYADLSVLDKGQLAFYHGFDASADSQTVGNLAAMMFDKAFMRHGHKAVILAGGATSLIGDPGGKDSERILQGEEIIAHNVARAEEQLKKVFAGHDFTLVNNLDWTKGMTVIEFLRDIGKHFSMTPLVQRDYIAKRLGEGGAGISYTEFSYTLLQGMDFLHLYDNHGVTLQLGGSDQWGNCLSGVDLVRRARGVEAHVITLPLIINKATGKKFGKSEDGAVWLDPQKTSPTQFYQFWINADDEGVEGYLKIFTELNKAEVDEIMAKHHADPKQRVAQTRLAQEVTKIVHSDEELVVAQKATEVLTGNRPVAELDDATVDAIRGDLPNLLTQPGIEIADVLVQTGLASSKTEARRLLQGNAISVNGVKTQKEHLEEGDFQNGRLLIRKGKAFKDSALIERA
jgi:tyrosyl-tRNA synthetase